jgi:hypothetical protein
MDSKPRACWASAAPMEMEFILWLIVVMVTAIMVVVQLGYDKLKRRRPIDSE